MPGGGRIAEAVAGGGPPLPVEPGPEVPFEKVETFVPVGVDLIQHWERGDQNKLGQNGSGGSVIVPITGPRLSQDKTSSLNRLSLS